MQGVVTYTTHTPKTSQRGFYEVILMTVCERLEALKAMGQGFDDATIAKESQLTPEEVHEVRVEYERGVIPDVTD